MTDYIGKYKDYVHAVVPSAKEVINRTKEAVWKYEDLFSETVSIDNVLYNVMVRHEKKSENKKIIFPPDTKIEIGSIVRFNNRNYLTMDFLGEGVYEVYPTATLRLCNALFPVVTEKTKVPLKDEEGNYVINPLTKEIIYKEEGGETIQIPCVIESKYQSIDTNEIIVLPKDELLITLPYHPEVVLGYQFIMYENENYRVVNLDRTKVVDGKGIISVRAKREVK